MLSGIQQNYDKTKAEMVDIIFINYPCFFESLEHNVEVSLINILAVVIK